MPQPDWTLSIWDTDGLMIEPPTEDTIDAGFQESLSGLSDANHWNYFMHNISLLLEQYQLYGWLLFDSRYSTTRGLIYNVSIDDSEGNMIRVLPFKIPVEGSGVDFPLYDPNAIRHTETYSSSGNNFTLGYETANSNTFSAMFIDINFEKTLTNLTSFHGRTAETGHVFKITWEVLNPEDWGPSPSDLAQTLTSWDNVEVLTFFGLRTSDDAQISAGRSNAYNFFHNDTLRTQPPTSGIIFAEYTSLNSNVFNSNGDLRCGFSYTIFVTGIRIAPSEPQTMTFRRNNNNVVVFVEEVFGENRIVTP